MQLEEVKQLLLPVFENHDLQYAGVFGSVARGQATASSDVDILVKFRNRPSFDAYLKLDDSIRRALSCDVDVLTEGGVNKFLRPTIEKDLQIVYEAHYCTNNQR